jgi:hypothetical protein
MQAIQMLLGSVSMVRVLKLSAQCKAFVAWISLRSLHQCKVFTRVYMSGARRHDSDACAD